MRTSKDKKKRVEKKKEKKGKSLGSCRNPSCADRKQFRWRDMTFYFQSN
jgi:hypothetical protein